MAFVTLVRPPIVVAKWSHTTPTCPPIGLAYLAGTLRHAGHEVRIVDAVGEAPFQMTPIGDGRLLARGLSVDALIARVDPRTEVIGLSCMFSQEWLQTRLVAQRLRERFFSVPIVAGGEHVTALAEWSLADCPALDVCVIGEGEETLLHLVDAIAAGKSLAMTPGTVVRDGTGTRRAPPRARIRKIDDIPPPAWDLVPLPNYLEHGFGFGVNRGRSMPMLATRGCPYQCTFCSNPEMWTTRWIARDPRSVFEEMQTYLQQYAIDNFDFYDLTAIVKRAWVVEFCELILASGLEFTWQLPSGTRSEAIDPEVSRLLYASGCRNMSYAPESGSKAVLEKIKKRVDLGRMKASMRGAVASGLNVKANIIVGFPDETHREVWETMRFIVEMAALGVHDMSISPFSPYPGSELFENLRAQGKLQELNDEYFHNLAAYTDLLHTVSVDDEISGPALALYRLLGMSAFYAVSYAARPRRLAVTLRNVFREQQESRLEMSLRDLLYRTLGRAPSASGSGRSERGTFAS